MIPGKHESNSFSDTGISQIFQFPLNSWWISRFAPAFSIFNVDLEIALGSNWVSERDEDSLTSPSRVRERDNLVDLDLPVESFLTKSSVEDFRSWITSKNARTSAVAGNEKQWKSQVWSSFFVFTTESLGDEIDRRNRVFSVCLPLFLT